MGEHTNFLLKRNSLEILFSQLRFLKNKSNILLKSKADGLDEFKQQMSSRFNDDVHGGLLITMILLGWCA